MGFSHSLGEDRTPLVHRGIDPIDRAPRGRELSVREGLTRIIVDWSGSWQAARSGEKAVMTKLGLTINEAKTSLRNARQRRFDFLGYSFGAHLFEANGN
jgi:hypothetical protein